MLRPLVIALALLAVAAPAAAAHDDAEIFATDNTATITNPKDPRLNDRLEDFARRVERIIDDGGGRPRGSELLDGVFAGDELTFERSRRFDVDRVSGSELHDIAETVRRRFLQQSVLTFDPDGPIDAIELEVPGVSARDLREGLLDDPEAAARLFGGSVTLDRHLILVAALEDATLARDFAKRIGGDLRRATTRYGDREFVDVATDGRARIERGTLIITGTSEDDTLRLRGKQIDFDDILSASTDAMALTLDGGDDTDVVLGGPGRDTLIGGDDFDDIKGGRGADTADLGADFDRFSWAPGDGSDTVDGGPSRDSLFFAGSADAETFELAGDRFSRDVGNIVMDLDDLEVVDAVAGAGSDTFRVRGDGDVVELNASLAPGGGAADPDRIELTGTEGDDHVAVTGTKVVFGSATVTGLPVKLGISFAQAGFDTLAIDTLGGNDSVDTSGLAPDVIGLETP